MKSNHFALIMAGGQGTRFWPWSSAARPKQFLPVIGDTPLLTQTWHRLAHFIATDHIFVIADQKYLPAIRECLPEMKETNFLAEPAPRNTAPALILANIRLSRIDPDANLLVLPADHFVDREEEFARQLQAALDYAENRCLITAGIKPDSPHTGYGYIQFDAKRKERSGDADFHPVLCFKEKPTRAAAQSYLRRKNFFWNSGMFIYKLRFFKEFLQTYADYYFQQYLRLEKTFNQQARFAEIFRAIKPESIDYALMEKIKEVWMVPARFIWNDVGSWSSVYEMNAKDASGNVRRGRPILIDTEKSLVFSTTDKPLAVIGLREVAVIHTADGILVADIKELQQVKKVIRRLLGGDAKDG